MSARLGYAVAFKAVRDVLVLDEIFAVGDAGFRARCEERYRQLRASGHTSDHGQPRSADHLGVLRPRPAVMAAASSWTGRRRGRRYHYTVDADTRLPRYRGRYLKPAVGLRRWLPCIGKSTSSRSSRVARKPRVRRQPRLRLPRCRRMGVRHGRQIVDVWSSGTRRAASLLQCGMRATMWRGCIPNEPNALQSGFTGYLELDGSRPGRIRTSKGLRLESG